MVVICHICEEPWDSAKETEAAEWVEVGPQSWLPTCPDCMAVCYPDLPHRASRSILGIIGFTHPPLPSSKVEIPYGPDE